jgi:hypothetical protein
MMRESRSAILTQQENSTIYGVISQRKILPILMENTCHR